MKRKYIWFFSFLIFSHGALANVGADLDNYFKQIGFASNTTTPKAYESQAPGLFGGGSLYARNPVREYELVTLDLPDYRAGCNGIDLFTGSLSYISSDKLVNLGKQVMTNGGAYAVDVMLATTVPELKQVRDFLQNTAQKINQSTINSCEMAQNLVGGVWPKTVASQEKICNDQRRMGKSGGGHDYVAAHMACAGDAYKETMKEASRDEVRKKQVILNKNLVWSLLQDKKFTANNPELAEMVMSLTGTVIIDNDAHVKQVPSMADNAELLHALLGTDGSQHAKIWGCDENINCLNVTLKDIQIPEDKGLSGRIRKIIQSMDEKLKTDTKLTPEEAGFLEMTSLPVMKFLLVLNSTQYGNAAVDIEAYSTLIAADLLGHYLGNLLENVSMASLGSELNDDLLAQLRGRIEHASSRLAMIEPRVGRQLTEKLALIQSVARVEKQLSASMSNHFS